MKKVISIFLSICMLLSITAGLNLTIFANDVPSSGTCGKNLTYTYTSSGGKNVLTISGTGDMDNMVNYYEAYNYYGAYNPFYSTDITNIVINDGVTSIGNWAFACCSSLTSITIPNSVTSIGDYAFEKCTSLTSITIPDSVTSIGENLFYNCTNLEKITLGKGVKYIKSEAFRNCSALKKVFINDVSSFVNIDFYGDYSNPLYYANTLYLDGKLVSDLNIPDDVTSISSNAFLNCTCLKSVTIPESVTSIGSGAFSGCEGLKSVSIPESVTSIGSSAFGGCEGLEGVYIKDVEKWCDISFENAFSNPLTYAHQLYLNYEPLTELIFPDSFTTVKDYIFSGCTSLEYVKFCDNVTEISSTAFADCSNINTVCLLSKVIDTTQNIVSQMPKGSKLFAYDTLDADTYCDIYEVKFVPLEEPKCEEGIHTCYEKVVRKATCKKTGEKREICVFCDEIKLSEIPLAKHTPGKTVKENVTATCTEDGTCDEVIYCEVCGEELSRGTVYIEKLGHTPGDIVQENYFEPTCVSYGSYDEVTYCDVCGEELDRETVTIDKLDHDYYTQYEREYKKATCISYGSYDEISYCPICNAERSRTTYTQVFEGFGSHVPGKQKVVKATKGKNGSIKQYCTVCGELINNQSIPKISKYELNNDEFTYKGKAIKPTVYVYDSNYTRLVNGRDYTVTYPSSPIMPDEYIIKITFIGNYSGSGSLKYRIYPKPTRIIKLKAGKGKIKVKWKRGSKPCDGYLIEYSTNKSFKHYKSVYVKGRKKTSKTIKGLKKGKRYYIRVWTEKNKYYNFSKTKSIRTKK